MTDAHGRLLVFDHIDVPAAGTQVLAGGIHDGETAEDAVVRELAEESGIESASIIRKLGETWSWLSSATSQQDLKSRSSNAFHLSLEVPPAEA